MYRATLDTEYEAVDLVPLKQFHRGLVALPSNASMLSNNACRSVSTCYSRQSSRFSGFHAQRARSAPSRAHKRQLYVCNLWLGADDWQKTLHDDCKYLGTGKLTLEWRSDKGEDNFLEMCEAAISSPKFSNLAELRLLCEHLPLDSRFIHCLQQRPQLRALEIHCWTYFDCTTSEEDSPTLRGLSGLKRVDIDMSDSTAFPDAWNSLVKKLPQLQDLRLTNRGCGYPQLNAGDLPKIQEAYLRNFKIEHGWSMGGLLGSGTVYKSNCC